MQVQAQASLIIALKQKGIKRIKNILSSKVNKNCRSNALKAKKSIFCSDWNEIWSKIEPDPAKKQMLQEMQPLFEEAKCRIEKKVQEIKQAKNDLIGEISQVSELIQNYLFPKLTPVDIGQLILWVETVNEYYSYNK